MLFMTCVYFICWSYILFTGYYILSDFLLEYLMAFQYINEPFSSLNIIN